MPFFLGRASSELRGAEGLADSFKSCVERTAVETNNLVGITTDGESANSGKKWQLSPPQRLHTAKIKAKEASARFLTRYGVKPGEGEVIQTIFEEYYTENDI